MAEIMIQVYCADMAETLRLELCPLTATANLIDWERAYGLATSGESMRSCSHLEPTLIPKM